MAVNPVGKTPLYTRQQVKSEAKMAATSAILSGGLTLALNKGHGIKRAGIVAATAACVSVLIGLIQKLRDRHNEIKAAKELSLDKVQSHQG